MDDQRPATEELLEESIVVANSAEHYTQSINALPLSALAQTFSTLLANQTQGRLAPIQWFRTDWQRGGALTGYSQWNDGQSQQPVMIKLPVPPQEQHWLLHLQSYENICPIVYAHGHELGGYDLAWVIMEKLPYGPLNHQWMGKEFDLLIEAAVRFYAATKEVPLSGNPQELDWDSILHRAREEVHKQALPLGQRWSSALKSSHRKLTEWLKAWDNRPISGWCHGDLHLGNAMTRVPCPGGPALLLDFALTRPGHWSEDAVYFEHLFWSRKERLANRKLCSLMAKERRSYGLPIDPNWPHIAMIKRRLLAISAPLKLAHHGDPNHLKACLEILES